MNAIFRTELSDTLCKCIYLKRIFFYTICDRLKWLTKIAYKNRCRNDPKISDRQVWANSVDQDQTAQGLHCLPFRLYLWYPLLCSKSIPFQFWDDYSIFSGVRIFLIFCFSQCRYRIRHLGSLYQENLNITPGQLHSPPDGGPGRAYYRTCSSQEFRAETTRTVFVVDSTCCLLGLYCVCNFLELVLLLNGVWDYRNDPKFSDR